MVCSELKSCYEVSLDINLVLTYGLARPVAGIRSIRAQGFHDLGEHGVVVVGGEDGIEGSSVHVGVAAVFYIQRR